MKLVFLIIVLTLAAFGWPHSLSAQQQPKPYEHAILPITSKKLNPWRAPELFKEIEAQLNGFENVVDVWARNMDSKAYAQELVRVTINLIKELKKLETSHSDSSAKNECSMLATHLLAFIERVLQLSQLEYPIDRLPENARETIIDGLVKGDVERVKRGAAEYLVSKFAESDRKEEKHRLAIKAAQAVYQFLDPWTKWVHLTEESTQVNNHILKGAGVPIGRDPFEDDGDPLADSPKKKEVWKAKIMLADGEIDTAIVRLMDGSFLEVSAGLKITHKDGNSFLLEDGREIEVRPENVKRD